MRNFWLTMKLVKDIFPMGKPVSINWYGHEFNGYVGAVSDHSVTFGRIEVEITVWTALYGRIGVKVPPSCLLFR